MTRSFLPAFLAAAALGCGGDASTTAPYVWTLPAGFTAPRVPADNPMSEAKVALGRRLFHDQRLSADETLACAGCHKQALAFTDGRPRAIGIRGDTHKRGAPSLVNAAYLATYNWENSLLRTLESQALVPLFGEDPSIELGMAGHEQDLLARLAADADYPDLFRSAYPGTTDPITLDHAIKAIASFVRTIVAAESAYDHHRLGDATALLESARRGLALFESARTGCRHCHPGLTFTDSYWTADLTVAELPFHCDGLYDEDATGAYPVDDQGLVVQTGRPGDMGHFRAPSLRNVAVTAPYMHDGSIATLGEVIDHYAAGGRARAYNEGRPNPHQDAVVAGFSLSPDERADLVAFLESLTDGRLLSDPRFADPFAAQ